MPFLDVLFCNYETVICTLRRWMRSLRSSFGDDCSSVDPTPVVKVHKMASSTLQNSNDRSSGFRESLRFFQNQVDKIDVVNPNGSKHDPRKAPLTNGHSKTHVFTTEKFENKTNLKVNSAVPSVDNILTNVKTLCSTRNGKNVSDTRSKLSSVSHSISSDDSKFRSNLGSVVYQTSNIQISGHERGVTRSEQVISVSQKSVASDNTRKQSLLSNFNPSLEFAESDQADLKDKEVPGNSNVLSPSKASLPSITANTSRKFLDSEITSTLSQNESVFSKASNLTSSKTVSNMADGHGFSNSKVKDSFVQKSKQASENKKETTSVSPNRTFGQCKDKLSQREFNKTPTVPQKTIQVEVHDMPTPTIVEITKDEDSLSEKQSESDYDSHDFIVHKASFPEDYLEAMSEDNYSSINEEYEVEHPNDPDIPSPDYPSDEEEYLVQHNEVPQYDDVEFIDNSAQYVNDPRRYIYYPDDKELEVIPEEDEDDIEDDDMYNHEEVYKRGSFQISNPSSDDSRYNNHGECDSGLTDDQRSSSSTAEECDIEDDTDSAKGSLPLQDSSTESPTNERANMFQNVEYHKSNKRHYPTKRIIEDYEKPKLKGKDVVTVSNINQNGSDTDDMRQVRNVTSSWDPKELLEVLYRLDTPTEPVRKQTRYINKEGYLEKLPSGRKKATYWNPWKTKYIKLKDGFLQCFDNNRTEKPSMTLQLMGGHIDTLENKMLGVDDQKGHYVVLRCSDDDETESWENALRSQCAEDFVNAYTSPCLRPLSINKNVIIIDLGSCSIRAGILMAKPTLPQIFIPTVCASSKSRNKKIFGIDALKPDNRKESQLSFPLHPSAKVTKYSIDVAILPDLLKYIFQELKVYPEDYKVQLSMPRNLSLQTKLKIARLLLDDFKVKGINLTHQAILSLHAYNSKSGIIVDIGDRLDVIPIIEGYIVESGVTRLPYGGQRMIHHLKHSLAEKNISLVSDVETYLARYVLEQLCYVAEDYNEELQRFHTNPDDFEMSISTSHFFKDDCLWNEVILDMGRFHVPEGLFVPEKWGLDNPGLHKLVHHAIQECGVDLRREMTRSIYVSGGLTLLPGFVERLENEVDKLTPNTITPKVHASSYRYHMSYIGACQIALEEKFDEVCITKQMWRKEGNTCVKKWHI
ncbi:actin [Trichonephila inaurata madagascariensis]|uniref:Actin n=1 Tax=Trichonephila inaurata madagascariensis TaxID=2747483 RepID=A0A8X6XP38_9ARAC|nr:actin [Trichonephila inaurata madagascariensis]